jgi:hypothetical protein
MHLLKLKVLDKFAAPMYEFSPFYLSEKYYSFNLPDTDNQVQIGPA